MLVRYTPPTTPEPAHRRDLKRAQEMLIPGETYIVLAIAETRKDKLFYVIPADESLTLPIEYPVSFFTIIRSDIPDDWVTKTPYSKQIQTITTYPEWANDPKYVENDDYDGLVEQLFTLKKFHLKYNNAPIIVQRAHTLELPPVAESTLLLIMPDGGVLTPEIKDEIEHILLNTLPYTVHISAKDNSVEDAVDTVITQHFLGTLLTVTLQLLEDAIEDFFWSSGPDKSSEPHNYYFVYVLGDDDGTLSIVQREIDRFLGIS